MTRSVLFCLSLTWLLSIGLVQSSYAEEAHSPNQSLDANAIRIALINITDTIDLKQAAYVKQTVEDAIAQKVDYIITNIDTNGGRLDAALDIFNTFLSLDSENKPRCIAFINKKAHSGGALIAFSHHEIYMTPTATIGDIGVISQAPEGKIIYAPEKIVSVIRAKLVKAANLRSWNAAWLQKMADKNQRLYEIRHNADKKSFVIEQDLKQFLADNPEIDASNEKQVVTLLDDDRLAILSGNDSIPNNVATNTARNLDQVYKQIGADKSHIIELTPKDTIVETEKSRVAFLHINEMIDPWQARYVQRAVDDAIANKVDYIITRIDTNGGRLDSALEIFNTFLNIDGEDMPRCIAFIDQKAYSAGALIAFSHHDIYMTRTASIGDIGVIFQTPEGTIEYAPEKMVSVVRTELIKAANLRGWDAAWLQKMTDRNQKLYEIRHNDEKKVFVIEENLNRYLADNPDIDRKNEQQVIMHRGEDRLITVAGDDAITYNMATDLVKNLDDVYDRIGADKSQELNLSPTGTESTARYLGSFAPLLLGLTVMLIIFEMKTAGVGLFAGLACVTGTLYFICNFYQNLVSYYEILLILIGVLLIIIEMFTMIGGGFLAIVGALVAFAGIFLSFMPNADQFNFDNMFYGDYLNSALLNSVLTLFVISVALILFIYAAPRLPIFQRLAVQAEISGTSEGALAQEEQGLVGQTAKALTQLRPSGQVQANNGKAYSATVKHGGFVDQGDEVIITAHRYGELIVQAIDEEAAS